MRFKRSSSGLLLDLAPSVGFCWGGCVADCCGGCGGGAELGPLEATEALDPEEGGGERSGPPEAPPGGSRNERRSSGSTSPNCGKAFISSADQQVLDAKVAQLHQRWYMVHQHHTFVDNYDFTSILNTKPTLRSALSVSPMMVDGSKLRSSREKSFPPPPPCGCCCCR